ncbi:MAG: sialate O-acetylesterase [Verrucomicrobiota bacterium]
MSAAKLSTMAILLLGIPVSAEVILAPLFQDGAVLQREKPVPIWGRASAGSAVTVSFSGQTKTTQADPSGRWQVALDAMPANAVGSTLSITEQGLPPMEIHNLLVGEVWLASGQSNMQWEIKESRPEDQAIAAAGPVPLLRLFQVPRIVNHTRQETVDAKWTTATPETALNFSAVAYFFGKRLTEDLKIPVGMIHSSWGGSRIEPWWAEEGLDGIDELSTLRTRRLAQTPGFPQYDQPFRNYVTEVGKWADAAGDALDSANPVPEMPKAPPLLNLGSNQETGTYQAMIHPLVPYGLRGFLWYQGESNNGEGMLYTAKMKALIHGWRKMFQVAEAPFLFVQLAPYHYGDNRSFDLPGIWWAQQETLKVPHTGMAVINDIGNTRDIHPTNKSEVARRLALWALADTYGQTGLVKSGPLFSEFKVDGNSVAVRFNDTGKGLTTRDGKAPNWFEVASLDGDYHPADARILPDGKTIVLTSAAVPQPDRARFAWSQVAEPNLMNREGLPAAAFNSHWPIDPTLGHKVSSGKPFKSSHPNAFGWNLGLTDGTWGNNTPTCYATDSSSGFPKTVTIDLGEPQLLQLVTYGTPDVGSTKTVAISISEDETHFKEVGRHEFPMKKAEQARARFEPTRARYVRATFIDSHPKQDHFDPNFGFLSEVEVYAP